LIYILSEEVQSGKTTSLQLCTENRYDIGGFLSPDKNKVRCLMNLQSKAEIPFEIDLTSFTDPIVIIGKFAIAKAAFEIGSKWVKEHLKDDKVKFVVIDEVGKLEAEGKGFAEVVRYAIDNIGEKNLILVIRSSLQKEILEKFALSDYRMLTKNEIDGVLDGGTEI